MFPLRLSLAVISYVGLLSLLIFLVAEVYTSMF